MKKIVVLFAFLTFLWHSLDAQTVSGTPVRFGIQASPTFSWYTSDRNVINRNGTNLGLKLQLVGEFYFQPNYAFTTGLGFAFNHGGTLQFDNAGNYWASSVEDESLFPFPAGVDLHYMVNYIEIPAGLKLRTREFGYLRYYMEPQLILGIAARTRGDVEGLDALNDIEIGDEVNTLGFSWAFGGGLEYNISESTSLVGGLYYQNLFTDISDKDSGDDSKVTLNGITIRIAVLF